MKRSLLALSIPVLLLLLLLNVLSLAAQSDGWETQYFNNPDLQNPPILTRTEPALAFNWGTQSPTLGIIVDNFSARFTRRLRLPQGSYRFWAVADDALRLRVDGIVLLDTFDRPRPAQTLEADVELPGGTVELEVEYREDSGVAYLYLAWWRIDAVSSGGGAEPTLTPAASATPSNTPAPSLTPAPTNTPRPTIPPLPTSTSTPEETPTNTACPVTQTFPNYGSGTVLSLRPGVEVWLRDRPNSRTIITTMNSEAVTYLGRNFWDCRQWWLRVRRNVTGQEGWIELSAVQ